MRILNKFKTLTAAEKIAALISAVAIVSLAVVLTLNGYGFAKGVGEKALSVYPMNNAWLLRDGQHVQIGNDQVTEVIGTESCEVGFDIHVQCWIFPLADGKQKLVQLANGVQEKWTINEIAPDKFHIVRPNGSQVKLAQQ